MKKHYDVLHGTITRFGRKRTFSDGELFNQLVIEENHQEVPAYKVFCTNRLLEGLYAQGTKDLYIWNRHIIAIGFDGQLIEDTTGVRNSFLYRDVKLLALLAITIVGLPYVVWVFAKKVLKINSLPEVKNGSLVA